MEQGVESHEKPPPRAGSKTELLFSALAVVCLTISPYLILSLLVERLPEAYGDQFLQWAGPFEGLPPEGIWNAQSLVLRLLVCVVGVLALYTLARVFYKRRLRLAFGRITKLHRNSLVKNLVFYFAIFVGLNVLFSLLDFWRFVEAPPGSEPVPANLAGSLLFFFFVAAAGPFFEEVLFRGFLYARLRLAFGFWLAFLVSGLFFSLLHFDAQGSVAFNVFNIANTMLFAYFATKTFEESGNLWNAVIFHGVYNGWLMVVMVLSSALESLVPAV